MDNSDDQNIKTNIEDVQLKVIDSYERLKICQSCDKYLESARICRVCKCFMPLKTRLKSAKCPLDKWKL